jgi:predicted nucleic acid-binding protein
VIHFDTSFVVDLLREASRGGDGPATTLLRSLSNDEFAVSFFALCELLAGAALSQRRDQERLRVNSFCSRLRIAYPDSEFAETYGAIFATTRRTGRNSGAMDLLIATAAVRESARLVTRDRKDFLGMAALDLISY